MVHINDALENGLTKELRVYLYARASNEQGFGLWFNTMVQFNRTIGVCLNFSIAEQINK